MSSSVVQSSTSGSGASTTRSPANDPHALPTFTSTDAVVKPSRTVLYLPPMLSSLPQEFSDDETRYASSAASPRIVYEKELSAASPVDSVAPGSAAALPPSPKALNEKLANLTEGRLPHIDPVSLELHRALHHFRPITENYSAEPYHESFNWDDLELPEHMEGEWYCVAFRSRRKVASLNSSDNNSLYEADRDAHAEAVQNGGLIMYWYGVPHPVTRDNLATCIWQSRAHAVAANSRPYHAIAARLAASSYEMYTLERYTLKKEIGTKNLVIDRFAPPLTVDNTRGGGGGCPGSSSSEGSASRTCPVTGTAA